MKYILEFAIYENNQKNLITIDINESEKLIIGRSGAHIDLNDAKLSKNHCQIIGIEGQLFLQDLMSRNGTQLNGKAIEEKIKLLPGHVIGLGDCEVVLKSLTIKVTKD